LKTKRFFKYFHVVQLPAKHFSIAESFYLFLTKSKLLKKPYEIIFISGKNRKRNKSRENCQKRQLYVNFKDLQWEVFNEIFATAFLDVQFMLQKVY